MKTDLFGLWAWGGIDSTLIPAIEDLLRYYILWIQGQNLDKEKKKRKANLFDIDIVSNVRVLKRAVHFC